MYTLRWELASTAGVRLRSRTVALKRPAVLRQENGIKACEVAVMTSAPLNDLVAFTPSTRVAFLQYLHDNPNNRRVSQIDKEDLIKWLTNSHERPSSQKEFSRRNYVQKTFAWDEKTENLLAVAKTDEDKDRTVVTEDMIADVVEFVHKNNGHAGWDATWKDVSSSHYGILRSDVIFLLKRCQICAQNPSKRPKGSAASMLNFEPVNYNVGNFLNTGDIQYGNFTSDILFNSSE